MIRKFKSWIQNYFGFSRRETNGSLILLVITIMLALAPAALKMFTNPDPDNEDDRRILDSLVAAIENNAKKPPLRIELVDFDPNVAGKEELVALGIDDGVAQRIINYRQAGGSFKIKEDLSRIYGLTEEEYARLEPFIDLPETPEATAKAHTSPRVYAENPEVLLPPLRDYIDINKADTAALRSLNGIGPVLSARIVRYRQALGGFTTEAQYAEVFGLDAETLKTLNDAAFISAGFIPQQINLNFASAGELQKHPYISRELARNIVAFRSANGPFRDMDFLIRQEIIPDSLLNKLKPYIIF